MRYLVNDVTRVNPKAKLTTGVIASITGLACPDKKYIQAVGDKGLKILKDTVICVGESVFKTERDITLNSANLDSGSFALGKDYYVYCCDRGGEADEEYKISLNSTFPVGYTATSSRKIGGFHYGHVRRTTPDTLEPINSSGTVWGAGWEENIYEGILPFSVWTLEHRPKCTPEGMIWGAGINKWVDIYILSTSYRSEYNGTPMTGSEGHSYYDFIEKIARKIGKKPLTYFETCCVGDGSPNGRDETNDYCWTKTTNSGRNPTGIIAKAVSVYGLKDVVGNVYKICSDISWTTQGSYSWRQAEQLKKGQLYATADNDLHLVLAGGCWSDGVHCGSRTAALYYYPWSVSSHVGCRFACESL